MKKTILTLTFLLCVIILKAQLFSEVSLYPNTTGIHGKYFSGTGGRGYWTYEKLDAFGRTVEKSSSKRNTLLAKYVYQYNDKHDVTAQINYSYDDLQRIDTFKYEYAYINNRIAFQKCTFSNNNNSITYRLVANQGDSVLTYQELSYHYYPAKKADAVFEQTYILTYRDRLLLKKEEITGEKKETTCYEYYNNGKLKRRIITREPASKYPEIYVGGPGSDDQSYSYIYDRKGRVKKEFTIIADKTYKLATYRYENKTRDQTVKL